MKRSTTVCLALLFFSFWGVPKAAAADTGTIQFNVSAMPEEIRTRTVIVTAGAGPADDAVRSVTLSGLNDFSAAVDAPAGEYFCTAVVQYDPAMDYPVTEESGAYSVTVEPGETVSLHYVVGDVGYYEQITGNNRYFSTIETETVPNEYDTSRSAQIGVYLTAPEGFDQHVVAGLANRYTGRAYTLDVYASNLLAALLSNAEAGKYQFLGAYVVGDDAERYEIAADTDILTTDDGVNFHLTVTDTQHPDRKLITPSRDKNLAVQQATQMNAPEASATPAPPTPAPPPTVTSAPDTATEKSPLRFPWMESFIIAAAAVGLIYSKKKRE